MVFPVSYSNLNIQITIAVLSNYYLALQGQKIR